MRHIQKIADDVKNVQLVQNLLASSIRPEAMGLSPMEELQLKYNASNQADIDELRKILSQYLTYPSKQIAEVHAGANRLGILDLNQTINNTQGRQSIDRTIRRSIRASIQNNQLNTSILNRDLERASLKQIMQDSLVCPCCGFVQQPRTLPLKAKVDNINHIGVSTFLFFQTMKNLTYLLLIILIVFSCYSIITNKIASTQLDNVMGGSVSPEWMASYQGISSISVGSKQLYPTSFARRTFAIQCWLGFAMIVIWGIFFTYIKYKQRQAEYKIDYDSKTASDYTLLFQNMPKNMTKQQLQRQLQQYRISMLENYDRDTTKQPIKIAKINQAIPFYLDESSFDDKQLKDILKQHKKSKEQFIELIEQRQKNQQFSKQLEDRKLIYKRYDDLNNEKKKISRQIVESIKQQKMKDKQYQYTVPTFVTFASSYNKQFLERTNDRHYYKKAYYIFCKKFRKYYHYQDENGGKVRANIQTAPEPEDIMWTNLGQSNFQQYKKKLITYGITFLILLASFWITFGLSKLQRDLNLKNLSAQTKSTINSVLSAGISLVISVINMIIKQILNVLTKYQRNPTYIDEQTSLGLKAAMALLINSILIPIMVNYLLKTNIYGVNGLAEDVFYLAITNSLLSPILKIIDLSYIYSMIMKRLYFRPNWRLPLNQNELNAKSQPMQFSIGYEYIQIVNLFLFTCFFVSLQPIIVVFAIIGLVLLYWAQKYSLYNRCRRPTPGDSSINTAMYQLIFFGPMMYSIGSFCWSNLIGNSSSGTVPNIVAASTSLIVLLLPYKKILKCFVKEIREPNMKFEDDRIFLPSEYDRLNPSTAKQGVQDYMKYLVDYKKNLQKKTPEQLRQFEQNLYRQNNTGYRHRRRLMGGTTGMMRFRTEKGDAHDQVLKQFSSPQNSVNPVLITAALIPQAVSTENSILIQKPSFNVAIQNWLIEQQKQIRNSYGNQNNGTDFVLELSKKEIPQINRIMAGKNQQANQNGDLQIGLAQLAGSVRKSTESKDESKNIPMNMPVNLFGSLLSGKILQPSIPLDNTIDNKLIDDVNVSIIKNEFNQH